MEAFIARLDDNTIADLLGVDILGRGAFRRFKDILGRWPEQLEAWDAFSEERQLGRACVARGPGLPPFASRGSRQLAAS